MTLVGIDAQSFRIVLLVLGAIALVCITGVIGLTAAGIDPPTFLELSATSAITGLIGLLVQSPHSERPVQANIINPTGDPVKVEAVE